MSIEVGTTLYRYTIRNRRFYMHEGIVNQCVNRKVVVFNDGGFNHGSVRCPRPEDIGVIRNANFSLWLTKRDDRHAKQMFIDYEERQVSRMERLITEKRETIEMLKEGK